MLQEMISLHKNTRKMMQKQYVIGIEFSDGTRTSIETDSMRIYKVPSIDKKYIMIDGVKAICLFRGIAQPDSPSRVWYNNCQLMDVGVQFIPDAKNTTPMITRIDIITNIN